jgi:hypothetical protein
MTEPSATGLRRYPSTGGYYELSATERLPCTCNLTCGFPYCSGVRCGCEACGISWAITLDEMGLNGPDGYTVTEEEGREQFGPNWPDV